MSGNSIGKSFIVTTFGESHGAALGVVIDGVPGGLLVEESVLQQMMERRRPGRLKESTSRNEKDTAKIVSGVFQNKTLGSPITVIVENHDQRSEDYKNLKNNYRPGHADKTTIEKYGIRDHRGGGRASGRETLARVIAGYFASIIIPNVRIQASIIQMGELRFEQSNPGSRLGLIDSSKDEQASNYMLALKQKGDSCGGEVLITGQMIPSSLGEPVFDKLRAELSKAITSIGSCMGINFGRGAQFASLLGSDISNDPSSFGGMEGGISNGADLKLNAYFKAPSTIGENAKSGRHDPCILPRVLVVIESMVLITLADHYLRNLKYKG